MNTSEMQLTDYRSNSYSENFCRFSPFRNATPLSRTNSRQNPVVNKDVHGYSTENRSNESKDGQSKINSGLVITPRTPSSSATHIRLQTRDSLNSRITSSSRKDSATKCQRSHSAVYKTDESKDSDDTEEPITIEKEIVKGNRIAIPPIDTSRFEDIIAPIKEIQLQENDTGIQDSNLHPEDGLSMNSLGRKADRAHLKSRGSSLMLGSGKVRKSNNTETLELHIDESEFSSVQDQVTSHVVSVTIGTSAATTPPCIFEEDKPSPRPVEVILPKTFITKSGSLLLYSGSELMKERDLHEKKEIEVKGRKMSPRTLVPRAYPYWGKHMNRGMKSRNTSNHSETDSSTFGWIKRDQRDYISINKQNITKKPYSWDYTVLPAKLIHDGDTEGIKTVSSLSEAVLAYKSTLPTSKDKYIAMMKQSRGSGGKTQAERMNELQARQLQRLSTWTREWVGLHGHVMFQKADKAIKDDEADKVLITKLRKTLKKSVQTPANTPSRITKQTYVHNFNKMDIDKLLTNSPRSIGNTDVFISSNIRDQK